MMTHECPGPGCERRVSAMMLACDRHWYQVPRHLRDAVYRAWNDGQGAGTAEHAFAARAAIKWMRP